MTCNFVRRKLEEWNLHEYIKSFEKEEIDEESFELLDDQTIELLFPKAGPRLRFKKHFKSFLTSYHDPPNNVSSLSDSNSSLSSLEKEISVPIITNISYTPATGSNSANVYRCPDTVNPITSPGCSTSTFSYMNTDSTSAYTFPASMNADSTSANTFSASMNADSTSANTFSASMNTDFISTTNTFSKVLDIEGIVKKKLPFIHKKLFNGDQINILEKYRINRLLVDSYIKQISCRPTTRDKVELAKHIVKTFPVLKGTDGEGHEQWFSPGVKGGPARGFIAERCRNFRMRHFSHTEKEALGIGRRIVKIKKEPGEDPLENTNRGSEDTSTEFLQKQQWLKQNTRPLDQVLKLMSETFVGRRYQIFKNPDSVFQSWPRLLDQHVIDAEFKLIFGEKVGDNFCSEFGNVSTTIITQARHCGRTAAEEFANSLLLYLSKAESSNEEINCALMLLPMLMPQGVFKKPGLSRYERIKPTANESLDHFIQHLPENKDIVKFMREGRDLDGDPKQPFVLTIGEKLNPAQIFLVYKNYCIETTSVLKAVDLCFKLTSVLNLEFSPYCRNVWSFLNVCFYKCHESKDMATCVRELKSRIF